MGIFLRGSLYNPFNTSMEGLFPKEEPLSFKIFKFWWFQSRIKIWILSVKIKIFYLKMRLSLTLEDRHRQTEALRALNFFVVVIVTDKLEFIDHWQVCC